MKEYIIAYLLEPIKEGSSFGRWPLHITIIPWFETDNPKQSIESLQRTCSQQKPFEVTVGKTAFFGPKNNVEVNLIENSPSLMALHESLARELEKAGAVFLHKHYMNSSFHPHITKKAYARAQKGFAIQINNIHIIEAPIANKLTRLKKVIGIGELQ